MYLYYIGINKNYNANNSNYIVQLKVFTIYMLLLYIILSVIIYLFQILIVEANSQYYIYI